MDKKSLIFIGWMLALLVASAPVATKAAESSKLTIYVYPPSEPLDWRTPRLLIASIADIALKSAVTHDDVVRFISDFKERGSISSNYRSTMGHAIARVGCRLPNGSRYEKWASFSGQDFIEVDQKLLLDDKIGMGVVFHKYLDGHIIAGEENVKRLTYYTGRLYLAPDLSLQRVRPRYLEFAIGPAQCERLKDMIGFFEGFHFPPGTTNDDLARKPPESVLYYTSVLDPFRTYLERRQTGHGLVGGGCAPFAAALLKISDLFEPIFERRWPRRVPISEWLIGNPEHPVGVEDLIFSYLGDAWNFQGIPNRLLSLYDPQLMWNFIDDAFICIDPRRDPARECPTDIAQWLEGHGGGLKIGPVRVFSDINPKSGEKVTQPAEGLIIGDRKRN